MLSSIGSTFVAQQASRASTFKHYPGVTAVRLKLEQNQLVDVFGKIGVQADGLKGA
jgi:hypothetical protein